MRAFKALALTLIFTALSTCLCFADMVGENGKTIPAATVNIPITHEITGDDYDGDDEFTFILTAEDEKNPMPEGAVGLTKTVTVTGNENPDFGDIIFEYPDAYYYTYTRKANSHKHITEGTESYRVMIAKYNTGSVDVVMWNKDGEKVEQLVFEDIYEAPKKPKTGDSISKEMLIGLSAMVVCGALGLFIIAAKKRRESEQE